MFSYPTLLNRNKSHFASSKLSGKQHHECPQHIQVKRECAGTTTRATRHRNLTVLTVLQCKIPPPHNSKRRIKYIYIFKIRFAFLCGNASQATVICKNCKIYDLADICRTSQRTTIAHMGENLYPQNCL